MIKLLIVDDEKTTRESLRDYIPWNDLGIDAVETARNGLNALENMQQFIPDILLTDVRMPKMDGIELATRVRELYPDCRIIFLSGYSDKEYLKSAIHLKAVSYIEKPINIEEIKAVVCNTVKAFLEESEKKASDEKLINSFMGSIPLIRQEIALALVKNDPDLSALEAKHLDIFSSFSKRAYFTPCNIILNWFSNIDLSEKDSLKRAILDSLSSSAPQARHEIMAGFNENGNLAAIMAFDSCIDSGAREGVFNDTFQSLKELSQGRFAVSIGIGEVVRGIKKISPSYSSSVQASKRQFYLGANRIFRSYDTPGTSLEEDKSLLEDFKNSLKNDDKSRASGLLKKLTERARNSMDSDVDHVKNIYFSLLLIIFEVARDRGLLDLAVKNEKCFIWQEIDNISTLRELSEYIHSNLEGVFNRIDQKDAISRKAYEIMQYVREHYADKDISIQSIASQVFLSQTYLCSFFKKTTGKTLNEFITEVRVEKAKELLKDNKIKLYEIAPKIGFSDVNYFSTIFKKYAGCTPSEFRERYYL